LNGVVTGAGKVIIFHLQAAYNIKDRLVDIFLQGKNHFGKNYAGNKNRKKQNEKKSFRGAVLMKIKKS
jgi:hypothetical protein